MRRKERLFHEHLWLCSTLARRWAQRCAAPRAVAQVEEEFHSLAMELLWKCAVDFRQRGKSSFRTYAYARINRTLRFKSIDQLKMSSFRRRHSGNPKLICDPGPPVDAARERRDAESFRVFVAESDLPLIEFLRGRRGKEQIEFDGERVNLMAAVVELFVLHRLDRSQIALRLAIPTRVVEMTLRNAARLFGQMDEEQ